MGWRAAVQSLLRGVGYEFVRWPLAHFLRQHTIDTVLDVGANDGEYARTLRSIGYKGRIVSFEPLSRAFDALSAAAASDPDWHAVRLALGDTAESTVIHVAGNSASSSLLGMLPRHTAVAPQSAYVAEEIVTMERLDAVFDSHVKPGSRVFLKIDTQGYESRVLSGAEGVLDRVVGLQVELSLEPLYEGQSMAEDVMAWLRRRGFQPHWVNHGFKDAKSQQLLQIDALFFRGT